MYCKLLAGAVVVVLALVGCGGPVQGGGGGGGGPRGPGQFDTPAQLLNAAPPAWQPTGPAEQLKGVSFQRPTDWEEVVANDDMVMVASPTNQSGERCAVMVLASRPVASTDDARFAQALQVAEDSLLEAGDTFTDDFGDPTPLNRAFHGSTGNGWDYAGLTMKLNDPDNGTFDVISMLAYAGTSAVPLLVIEPVGSWGCVGYNGEFGLNVANVFYSLVIGSAQPDHFLEDELIGNWFSSSGSVGNSYVFGANGQYLHVAVAGGWVELFPGQWEDRYASWSGDGSWAAVGSLMATFPKGQPASSHFARQFEVRQYDGTWQETLCWVDAYDSGPFSYCTQRMD